MQDVISGADHEDHIIFPQQTWHIDRCDGELVPFDSLFIFKVSMASTLT